MNTVMNTTQTISKMPRLLLSLVLVLAMTLAACEGPEGPQGPEGEQGSEGPQGPQGPPGEDGQNGEDGNANVTLYIFDGYDFTGEDHTARFVELNSEQEMRESAWLYYLVLLNADPIYYNVPGFGGFGGDYLVARQWTGASSRHVINCVAGGCGEYGEIHIVRIAGTNVVDNRSKQTGDPLIPDNLDVSDYEAVMEYYRISD